MNIHTTRQTGFATTAIIAIVLAVAVIGSVAFFISNHNTKTKPADAANTTPPAAAPKDNDTTPTPASPTSNGTSLVIKEWAVTIPLSEAVKDAYYVASVSSVDDKGGVNTIWLGQTSLDTLGCKASDANVGKKPLAGISKVKPTETDPINGELYTKKNPDGITIGGYYYFYNSWASTNTCAPKEKLAALDSAIKAAIKSATLQREN